MYDHRLCCLDLGEVYESLNKHGKIPDLGKLHKFALQITMCKTLCIQYLTTFNSQFCFCQKNHLEHCVVRKLSKKTDVTFGTMTPHFTAQTHILQLSRIEPKHASLSSYHTIYMSTQIKQHNNKKY